MKDFLFALNAVLPIFLLIVLGFEGTRRNFLAEGFRSFLGSFVFKICLPALVFNSLYRADFSHVFSPGLALYVVGVTLLSLIPIIGLSHIVSKDAPLRGSFIQGCFRGNYVIIALPLIGELFGPEGKAEASILVAFLLPLYNLSSVIILDLHSRGREGRSLKSLLFGIATNPLLLGVAAALPFALLRIELPLFLSRFIDYLAATAMPLALIDVGAGMASRRAGGRKGIVATAIVWKLVVNPIAFILGASPFGFAGRELGIVYLVGAAPTAVASYTMACSMGCDEETAGGIVVFGTLASLPTFLLGIWFLKSFGII